MTRALGDHREGRLRSCTPADAAAVVALYNRCFAATMTVDRWRWQYLEVPDARPDLSIVWEHDGGVLGFVGAVPQPWWRGGERIEAVRIQDVCVAEEARGRGIFSAMLRAQCRLPAPPGFRIAFPNPQSQPAFLRDALFQRHDDIEVQRCPVAALSAFDAVDTAGVDVTVEHPPQFTAADSALLDAQRRGGVIAGARTLPWLQWRFGPRAPNDYVVVRARQAGALIGLVVAKHYAAGGTIDLVECSAVDRFEVTLALVRGVLAAMPHTQPQALEVWSPERYSHAAHLRQLGFVGGERHTAMVTRAPSRLRSEGAAPWLLSLADSDVY